MRLIRFLRKLNQRLSSYSPSVELLISKKSLVENLRTYQKSYPSLTFAPVLKSNAYGHGLLEVAKALNGEKFPFIVLDSLHEAMILRRAGIRSSILIVGYTRTENIKSASLSKIAFTVVSLDQLKELCQHMSSAIKIHLKVDTGMHRQGILPEEISEAFDLIRKNRFLNLEGLCSHFADADGQGDEFTQKQIDIWNKIVLQSKKELSGLKFFHISATAGAAYSQKTEANVARLGIGLYGYNPVPSEDLKLHPALQMESIISSLRKLKAGEYVGYNASHRLEKDALIATVPVGYFEGVDRRLSNKGFFKLGEHFCPIVGRVSMNITSIDVSALAKPSLGDKVIVISKNSQDKNSLENMAALADTIPWDIMVRIPPQHLRRTLTE